MGHKRLVSTDEAASYPSFLKSVAKQTPINQSNANSPIVIKMGSKSSKRELESVTNGQKVAEVIDNYGEQYAELLLSKNAHLYTANYSVQVASIKDMLDEHYGDKPHWEVGSWVYYPWSQRLVHVLEQEDFENLRSIRNRDLITADEQKKLLDYEVGCFGMSVGSASAQAIAISSMSRKIKLIDGAAISGSNLNRILTGVENVGLPKALVIARQIYEMNPYTEVKIFDKMTDSNSADIFDKPWPLKLAIDEIDDLEMKIKIRVEARKRRIPVLMASELGDTVILDIERYDMDANYPLFHGSIPGVEDYLKNKIENRREWMKLAVKILDPNNMPLKLQHSLLKIGTTIVTHPQLGSTVMMTGGVIAFAVKNIVIGSDIRSGRYTISLEDNLLRDHQTRSHKKARKKHIKVINKAMESM
jgi:molybdopterin/thiamine biosynthesis adenylyltransferase